MSSISKYFPHQYNAHDDEKLQRVMMEHGLVGYAIFFLLLEYLGQKEDRILPKGFYKILAWNYRIEEEIVRSVVEDFDLFEVFDNQFSSGGLNDRMASLDDKIAKRKAAGALGGLKRVANLKQNSSNAQAMLEENQANSKQCLSNVEANSSNKNKGEENNKEKSTTNKDKSLLCCAKKESELLFAGDTTQQDFNFDERVCDYDFLLIVSKYMRKYAISPVEEAYQLIDMMHPTWSGKYQDYSNNKADATLLWQVSKDRKYKNSPRTTLIESKMIDAFIELVAAAEIHDVTILNSYRGMDITDNIVILFFSKNEPVEILEEKYIKKLSTVLRKKYGDKVMLEYRVNTYNE